MPIKKSFNKTDKLKKVTAVFFKKGYHATSMQDIVKATGLNRSSIYNTFGSKLELFITCFEKCDTNQRKEIQKIILEITNPIKALINIFELSINPTINGHLNTNYISELKNEEIAIRRLVINEHEYLLDLFLNIVKRGQNIGTINNSKSANLYALYLVNAYQGLKISNHISEDENSLKNVIQNTISLLE